jgi:hypothetical protein
MHLALRLRRNHPSPANRTYSEDPSVLGSGDINNLQRFLLLNISDAQMQIANSVCPDGGIVPSGVRLTLIGSSSCMPAKSAAML